MASISLLIPVYKNHAYAIECVKSALLYADQFLEIVIVDDCPNEPLSSVWPEVVSLSNNVKYAVNSVNVGRSQTYNILLSVAVGDFYIMLDGDDLLRPSIDFRKLKLILSKHSNVTILSGRCLEFDSSGVIRVSGQSTNEGKSHGIDYFSKWISVAETLPHSASIIRLSAAKTIGGYPLNYISSDISLLKKLLIVGDIYIVNDVLSCWRYHGGNASRSIDIDALTNNLDHIVDASCFAMGSEKFSHLFITYHIFRSSLNYIIGCCHQFIAADCLFNLFVFYQSIYSKYKSNFAVAIAAAIAICKMFSLLFFRFFVGSSNFKLIMKKRGNYLYR